MNGIFQRWGVPDSLRRRALIVGAAALVLALIGALFQPAQFFRSYLFAYLFWVSLPLGGLAILMIHHLTGGAWGFVIRRPLEAMLGTLPWLAVLFLPLLAGLHDLYPWAQPELVAADPKLHDKAPYLNETFFIIRAAVYFAVWIALGYSLLKGSDVQDRSADPAVEQRLRRLSAGGLILYALTVTFAAVDWVMALEPHWYSATYGVLIAMGQWVEAFASASPGGPAAAAAA